MKVTNKSNIDTQLLQDLLDEFYPFAKERFGITEDPLLEFVSDEVNSRRALGTTAYYDPRNMTITVFVDKRHPKDIMRSVSHELVHHAQNCSGELDITQEAVPGYAQTNSHLRAMEEDANLRGTMCFRDWEDLYKRNNPLSERKERLFYKLQKKLW